MKKKVKVTNTNKKVKVKNSVKDTFSPYHYARQAEIKKQLSEAKVVDGVYYLKSYF